MLGAECGDLRREFWRRLRVQYHCLDQLRDIHWRRISAAIRHHIGVDQLLSNLVGADRADDRADFLLVAKEVPLVCDPMQHVHARKGVEAVVNVSHLPDMVTPKWNCLRNVLYRDRMTTDSGPEV